MAANHARDISTPWRVSVVAAPYFRMSPRSGSCIRAGLTIPSCLNRLGSRDCRYRSDKQGATGPSGRHSIYRCGSPVIRRPRWQRGSHGDRGEPEHIAVTNVAR